MTEEELKKIYLIQSMMDEWTTKFENGEYDGAWKLCMDAWDLLPEPKYKQSISWFMVLDIVKYAIETY